MRGFITCLVLLAAAGFGAYWAGWLDFETDEQGKTHISIDNNKLRQDTNNALDKGRQLIDRGKDAINKSGDAAKNDQTPPNGNDQTNPPNNSGGQGSS